MAKVLRLWQFRYRESDMTFTLGTVSEGTLRTEDLLDAFSNTLAALAREEPQNHAHLRLVSEAQTEFADAMSADDYEQAGYVIGELEDALGEYCPPFIYFGAHPGDGADFGFWADADALDDALRYAEDTDDDDTKRIHACGCDDECGVLVQTSDHGNITVMDMKRNELWSMV
jgi:hypothetical protein